MKEYLQLGRCVNCVKFGYNIYDTMRQYLKIKDAADYVGVTPLTLRNWDRRGKLAAYRHPVNNYRLYLVGDLERFVKRIEGARPRKLNVVMLED